MSKIYRHPTQPVVDFPQLDLLTLLFDSEHSPAPEETVLHVEAANPSNKITKGELRDLTQRVAHGLRNKYGVGSNGPNKDVVTVVSHGQIMAPVAFLGIIAAGGVYSAASPSATVSELARQIQIGQSELVICGAEHKKLAIEAAKQCKLPLSRVLVLESDPARSMRSLEGNVDAISDERLAWVPVTDPKALKDSLITILWSSGTTGLPKGVMISHRNLVSETYLLSLPGREWAMQEIERVGLDNFTPPELRTLAHLPISHIAGLFGYLIGPIYSGATVYWMRRYRWAELLRHAREFRITMFYTVPSIYLRIAKSRAEVGDAFAHVEAASTGAAPMDGDLQAAANAALGDGAGTFIGQTWGLSETTGAVTAMPKGHEPDATGSISPIMPCVELRIVNDDYRDVDDPAATPGELLVRAPMVTNGYFRNPEATRAAFHDGWFCTGDLAVLRDGKFYIVDRKKELLKYKGLQIAPAELENLLFTHPHVREAAVVGVPAPGDPGTEWPRAYLVADPDRAVSAEEVQRWVKERVADHKQLRGGVVFVAEIPKNAIGKFLRRELRDRARKEVAGKTAFAKL